MGDLVCILARLFSSHRPMDGRAAERGRTVRVVEVKVGEERERKRHWNVVGFAESYTSKLDVSASSQTLVSKVKSCISVKLQMTYYISHTLYEGPLLHG